MSQTQTAPIPTNNEEERHGTIIPENHHGWVLTDKTDDDGEEEYQWWKKGSNHISAAYERVKLTHYQFRDDGKWAATQCGYNKYGQEVNSRTLNEKSTTVDYLTPDEAFERCMFSVTDYMKRFPARKAFDGKPSFPESVRGWELAEREYDTKRWEQNGENIIIRQVGRKGGYCSSTRFFTVEYSIGDEPTTILSREIRARCMRAAIRIMKSYPNGGIGSGEVYDALKDVHGIGPAKAKQLQLQGVTSVVELARLCRDLDEEEYERREKLDKILTKQIRSSL